MNKKILILFCLALIALFTTSIFAQTDTDDPLDNACNTGGSMEGKCDGDANDDGIFTEEELEWAWDCGWYLARWERGQGEVPTRCESLVSSAPVFPSAGCIEAYPGDFFNFNGSYFIPLAESDIYSDPACTILGDFVGIDFVYAPAPYDPNELCMIAFNLPTAFGPHGDNDIYTCDSIS